MEGGDVADRDRRVELADGTVGKGDVDHSPGIAQILDSEGRDRGWMKIRRAFSNLESPISNPEKRGAEADIVPANGGFECVGGVSDGRS